MSLLNSFKQEQPRNDFDVIVTDRNWSREWEEVFSAQVTRLDVDLLKVEVTFFVRQLRAGVIQDCLFNLLTREETFDKVYLKPARSKKGGAEYSFINGRIVGHACKYDYFSKEPIMHHIKMRFERVSMKSPTGDMKMVHYGAKSTEVEFDPSTPE